MPLLLSDNYNLSLPVATPRIAWAVGRVGNANTIREPTEAANYSC
jgi:hypothetical protein